ncbi:hypothetical protein [Endozoicomonas sp. ONNA2]|uniref:hypothetical protein n=1 Tax=Endozoicomonas sp. ONNA2 TaxID=2828741 RepID=UPI002148F871|nr:hypothetical protein [Endozoicomonas sp. ONNA2]
MSPENSRANPAPSASAYPVPSVLGRSKRAKRLANNFQSTVKSLPPRIRRNYIHDIMNQIGTKYHDDLSAFNNALNERRMRLADNSSETPAVLIHPLKKLMTDHQYFALPFELNELIEYFNGILTAVNDSLKDPENPDTPGSICLPYRVKALFDFMNCVSSETGAIKAGGDFKKWHSLVKLLCEGVLGQLLDNSASLDHKASEKKKGIDFLNELDEKHKLYKGNECIRIHSLISFIGKGYYDKTASSHLSGLIFDSFIGSGDLAIFLDTLELLFKYYQFVPEKPFIKFSTEQHELIKSLSEKR